jgi:hypothetical protein
VPGQSLDDQIQDLACDRILAPVLSAMLLTVLALMEWYRYLFHVTPTPQLYTAFALIGILWAVWRIKPAIRQLKDLKLGRMGETAVGQYLEEVLRPRKYHVLHDIPGDGFNIDHVIVGPTGIFCVETKTRSKPLRGNPTIQYDGEKITVDGFEPDRDPVVQSKASARWLHELLESSTGKKFAIQPVVLFPGWYVEKMPEHPDVWVLNEKAVPTFVQNAKTPLPPDDVSLIVFHLKRYVISSDQKK